MQDFLIYSLKTIKYRRKVTTIATMIVPQSCDQEMPVSVVCFPPQVQAM